MGGSATNRAALPSSYKPCSLPDWVIWLSLPVCPPVAGGPPPSSSGWTPGCQPAGRSQTLGRQGSGGEGMSVDVSGCQWMSVDVSGCQWMSVDISGFVMLNGGYEL